MDRKYLVVKIFRYFWLALALALVFYLLSQAIVTKRTLVYHLDFSHYLTRDIYGWYPEVRTKFLNNKLNLLAEPIYLKVYMPVDFKTLTLEGTFNFQTEGIHLGLRQKDGSWFWQTITMPDFSLNFSLAEARVKKNQLELILAVPDLVATSTLSLDNNWQLILQR
jgi:hypothetical protein